ncbi:d-amino acid oxidase [Fusarium coicis]|nr:d-amino acid oxidase [Fusarium coicis]
MSHQGETIVIVGAGVIGLSTALRVQEQTLSHKNPPSIVIIARDFPNETSINYATPWAGAHYRPCPGNTLQLLQEAVWAKKTYDTLDSWSEKDKLAAGVEFMPGEEFFENPAPEYVDATKAVSKSVYSHLESSFELLSSKEVFSIEASVSVVINCSGMGFGDPKVFPTRGQTCLVRNPISKTITRQNSDGSWSFAIPRPLEGGTIIGGTKEPHNWNPYPSAETRQTLLSNAAKWFPFNSEGPISVNNKESDRFDVVRDIVGRRPAREGGLRLELERLKPGVVVHAYGVGGRGLELSWGIADEVVSLLQKQGYFSSRARL